MMKLKSSKAMIMAGGRGTRLWPVSRQNKPKQFQKLVSDKTMLQETFERLAKIYEEKDIYVSTNKEHISEVEKELPTLPPENILAEPQARGTASCVAYACAVIAARDGEDTTIGIFPADHLIRKPRILQKAIVQGTKALETYTDYIITLGIIPTYPETGYGYIKEQKNKTLDDFSSIKHVERFIEKPDAMTAQNYIMEGDYHWNTGMYLFNVGAMIQKIGKYIPDTHKRIQRIKASVDTDSFNSTVEKEYPEMDKINIEYAVIENDENVFVIPIAPGWSDVGSWTSLKETLTNGAKKNLVKGEHIDYDSENLLVYGSKKLITTIGLKDLIIVDTEDAILICDQKEAQRVSEIVQELEKSNHKHKL